MEVPFYSCFLKSQKKEFACLSAHNEGIDGKTVPGLQFAPQCEWRIGDDSGGVPYALHANVVQEDTRPWPRATQAPTLCHLCHPAA